jgi:D-sedoheptulose 7-phosphate isomerase
MKTIITDILEDSIGVKDKFIRDNIDLIIKGADIMSQCIASGHKILIFGNGGSAADAQHISAEFINRFQIERHPLPSIALTTDTSIITSIGNDYHFDEIFSKQIFALGKTGDIAMGISTSGNSPNVVKAMELAKKKGLINIGVGGCGGKIVGLSDIAYSVQSDVTARIQETHITLMHILCELVDRKLFPESF